MAGLAWAETAEASSRWLAGESLDAEQRAQLGVTASISTEADAIGVLSALAAIHSHAEVRRPFMVLIDELEHFVRFDGFNGNKHNITWLKRLLESLGVYSTIVYVAKHWSAWNEQVDFRDRFNQTIDVSVLRAQDVLKIVQARVPSAPTQLFGINEADVVAKSGEGNMRKVLALCHGLFLESNGFERRLSD